MILVDTASWQELALGSIAQRDDILDLLCDDDENVCRSGHHGLDG
jgi:hypothetical protein